MPSAFTENLFEGAESFEKFVWRCARMMGACIHMRDEPLDVLPPEVITPGPYYAENLNDWQKRLAELEARSPDDWERIFVALQKQLDVSVQERNTRIQATRTRFEEMRRAVDAWEPPTADHNGLKEFMLVQIDDALGELGSGYEPPRHQSVAEFRKETIMNARGMLHSAERALKDEEERARARTRWLADLRASVPPPKR